MIEVYGQILMLLMNEMTNRNNSTASSLQPGCEAPESSSWTASAPSTVFRSMRGTMDDQMDMEKIGGKKLKHWKWHGDSLGRNWGSLGTSLVSLTWSRTAGTRSKQIQRNAQDATMKVLLNAFALAQSLVVHCVFVMSCVYPQTSKQTIQQIK